MMTRFALVAVLVNSAYAACPYQNPNKHDIPCPHGDMAPETTDEWLDPVADLPPPLSNPVDTTDLGCTCTSSCGASLTESFGHRCDWCWTADKCGHSGLRGYWDYCAYPQMDLFEAQSHTLKREQLWQKITDSSVVDKSGPAKDLAASVAGTLTESMITVFEDKREVMPKGRAKVIHSQGVVCQFKLAISSDSPFTGVLAPGDQAGLIRMGSATSLDGVAGQFFPGFGIKFLRSGVLSADWVALRITGPSFSPPWDYFGAVPMSNHVAPAEALVKSGKFQQASGCIDSVGLSDACEHTQAGEKVEAPVFPFEIMFQATGNVNVTGFRTNDELLQQLSGIPEGSTIYNVVAYATPADKVAGKKTPIGTLSTTSSCHRSLFGDLSLFFRHQRMEEDFALAPQWIPQMAPLKDSACHATAGPISQWQCPRV